MTKLSEVLYQIQAMDASDAQKFHALVKAIEIIETGKSPKEAFEFVKVVHSDGGFESVSGKTYSEQQMLDFGTYLLSDARKDAWAKESAGKEDSGAEKQAHFVDIRDWKYPKQQKEPTAEQIQESDFKTPETAKVFKSENLAQPVGVPYKTKPDETENTESASGEKQLVKEHAGSIEGSDADGKEIVAVEAPMPEKALEETTENKQDVIPNGEPADIKTGSVSTVRNGDDVIKSAETKQD